MPRGRTTARPRTNGSSSWGTASSSSRSPARYTTASERHRRGGSPRSARTSSRERAVPLSRRTSSWGTGWSSARTASRPTSSSASRGAETSSRRCSRPPWRRSTSSTASSRSSPRSSRPSTRRSSTRGRVTSTTRRSCKRRSRARAARCTTRCSRSRAHRTTGGSPAPRTSPAYAARDGARVDEEGSGAGSRPPGARRARRRSRPDLTPAPPRPPGS